MLEARIAFDADAEIREIVNLADSDREQEIVERGLEKLLRPQSWRTWLKEVLQTRKGIGSGRI